MTREMLNKWLEMYNALEKRYNREEELMERREKEGDTELAKRHEHKMDIIAAKQEGMLDVLKMFGYTVIYRSAEDKYTVVLM